MNIIILFSGFLVLFVLSSFVTVYSLMRARRSLLRHTGQSDSLKGAYVLGWKSFLLIAISITFIVASFFAPIVFTSSTTIEELDFKNTGQIGDTIGGLMNPFIAVAGVIITGLAFYIQYKANELQREMFIVTQKETKKQFQSQIDFQNRQFQLQQVESQFYEMIKLHRDNINEMRINGYDFEERENENTKEKLKLKKYLKVTEGRKVFVTMITEFEFILNLYKKHFELDKVGFNKCYRVFFSGLDEYDRKNPADKDFKKITDLLRLARAQHQFPPDSTKTNVKRKSCFGLAMNFNYKPFSGHSSRLGHYFRHLYLSVKSIANNNVISDYDDRMRYLRLLRAQLSNHEQMMLFYNWLSDFGLEWENEEQRFFTEYCMIHNLWWDNLIDDTFINEEITKLREKPTVYRQGKMFEID